MLYELLVLSTCFIANAIATITGFGVSTLLTPTLLWFFPLKEAVLLVCIVHLFHDLWKTLLFHRFINYAVTIKFGLSAVCAAAVSSYILATYQLPNLPMIFGVFLLLYAAVLLFNPHIRIKINWITITISGIFSGFIAGIFGIFGTMRSTFLLSFNSDKKSFAGTSGAISCLVNGARLVVYLYGGITLTNNAFLVLPFLLGTSFLGTLVGRYLVHRIPIALFRKIVLLFIIGAAINLIIISL